MDKDTRNAIERATQRARKLLEADFAAQLEGTFDILRDGTVAPRGGAHLTRRQAFQREKIVAAIEHKRVAGLRGAEAVADYLRDAAFTTLNRFVALQMLEARELVQECVSKGEQSSGYVEFCGLAGGVALLPESAGYRLYLECLFDELSTEVRVLFDRRDLASVLWPKRAAFLALLEILSSAELSGVWKEDETIGWVYQFFNSGDERKRMREESQAPRNSRELAVRNQFFTPRYVVEFLVDNTLGRTWLEMQGVGSALAEQCRYFVRAEDEEPRIRPRKDPRELRILDPACGSGHFLLYCFDLLLTIYEEGWGAEGGPIWVGTGQTLREDYPDLESLRRAVPGLILEHNLHGVDIDPRAAQIAALALWLRAQRAWKDFGVSRAARPLVRRTQVVVAEPMPGDAALVEEFAARLEPPLLRDLFRKMVSEMRLAGKLGTLSPVEKGIASEVSRAREQFEQRLKAPQFLPGLEPVRRQGDLDLSGIDDDAFFQEAEMRILDALRHFAEAASNGTGVRRRLFVGDAVQGMALIDLLRTSFDVVLMNPPFGAASLAAKKEFEKAYPRTRNDIYAAFVERGIQLLISGGLLGSITARTGFFLSSFQKWREDLLLKVAYPIVLADLGLGVMDAALVEAAAYCLEKGSESGRKTVFLRALEELLDKALVIRAAIHGPEAARGRQRFEVDPQSFGGIPGSPFAYWASDRLRALFSELPAFESEDRSARQGLATANDFRFVRAWWAVPDKSVSLWLPYAKGGKYSPFYFDAHLVVNWGHEGVQVKAYIVGRYPYLNGNSAFVAKNTDWYLRPGVTWPRRTKSELSLRVMPAGCVFGDKGPAAFVGADDSAAILSMLAVGNSRAFRSLLEFQLAAADANAGGAARSYEVGLVQRTPFPRLTGKSCNDLAHLASSAWSLKRRVDGAAETSHAFTLPALLQSSGVDLRARASAWRKILLDVVAELVTIQARLDQYCFDLYGIDEIDREIILVGFGAPATESLAREPVDDYDDDGTDEKEDEIKPDEKAESLSMALISWSVGVAFGRFEIRLAAGLQQLPPEPEPFDPLPVCSPGMLTGEDGLPLSRPPAGYPLSFPEDGILVDDPGHAQDLTASVRTVFDIVFGAGLDDDRWWNDISALLDPKDHDLRSWLAKDFFEFHLKRYSKSRRKAPIYWQLATPSTSFSVWLYAHRLTRDSFFQLQNDVVGPKLLHEDRQLTNLIQKGGVSPSASERKEIAAQEGLVDELRAMLDEVQRVAPLWNPNLDDGVVLTMAPLWCLVPQHKAWQKELRSKWDELCAGKYDWAHLAMHLWPERVVPKCATDRSLAIAHGLEEVFWAEGADGKWKARTEPTEPIEELVRVRTSPAVKAALKSLLEAPTPGGSGKRPRKGRIDA